VGEGPPCPRPFLATKAHHAHLPADQGQGPKHALRTSWPSPCWNCHMPYAMLKAGVFGGLSISTGIYLYK
jgi:hypothetical protein